MPPALPGDCYFPENPANDCYVAASRCVMFFKKYGSSLISKHDPHIFMTLKLDPATVELEHEFSRDVSNIGHWGTGDLELCLRKPTDFEKAKPLIERAYQEN